MKLRLSIVSRVISLNWPLLLLLFGAFAVPAGAATSIEPFKGPRDHREYRYLTLPNALRVLLVSDPLTDKSAAALDIRVGSRHDPDAHLGLSHFLEHMLFLGTRGFPEAGDYQRFIQAHGGSNNASTSYEHTNYFFDIENSHFRGGLERFSQFFVAPLFTASLVDRERHAVHSEYQARLKSDGSRSWDAMQRAFNPAHPVSRFTVGSLETLSSPEPEGLRNALRTFWLEEYSANRMTLALYGVESLDRLQAWAVELFGPIIDRGLALEADKVDAPLFEAGRLPAVLEIEPERDIRTLTLSFPAPPAQTHYRAKPADYLSNILGHEGEGSLLSRLKAKGWSDGLSAGLSFGTQDDALFSLYIRLTAEGRIRIRDIIGYVFQTVARIRAEGFPRWRQDEQARLLDLGFEFQEPASPQSYVVDLARAMHIYPPVETLRGPYLLSQFEPALIGQYLDAIRADNMLATVVATGVAVEQRSPYFDAGYRLGSLPPSWRERWAAWKDDGAIRLPAPNAFVPKSTDVLGAVEGAKHPVVLSRGEGLTLLHHQDATFGVPRANVYISLRSPRANDTPDHRVATALYLRLVREQLQEFAYPASLAGLDYELYPHSRGFTLRVSGYNDKLDRLLGKLVETLRTPTIDPARFAVEVDDLGREFENRAKDRSFRLASRALSRLLVKPSWTEGQRLAALRSMTPASLEAFAPKLLASLNAVMLVHGNVTASDAQKMAVAVRRVLTAPADIVAVPRASVVRMASGSRYRWEKPVEHSDSAISLYYQGRSRVMPERARMAFLRQILSAPFYLELRTRQQLGYVVFATGMSLIEVPGISFIIQSPGSPASELETRIRVFLDDYFSELQMMPDAVFERHRAGLLSRILESDKTLRERSNRYWREIDRRRLTFDSPARLAEAVRKVTKAELLSFYKAVLLGPEVREIAAWAVGTNHQPITARQVGETALVSTAEIFQIDKQFYRSE